jgi:hypothetical protein
MPFWFAGESFILGLAKGFGVHPVPIPWVGKPSQVAKWDLSNIVFQHLQT